MNRSEAQAEIKKLDLKIRQLRLRQRIIEKDAEQAGPTGPQRQVRRLDRLMLSELIVVSSVLIIMFVLISLEEGVLFGVAVLPFLVPGLALFTFPAFFLYRRQKQAIINAPDDIQRMIDELEAEIARRQDIANDSAAGN